MGRGRRGAAVGPARPRAPARVSRILLIYPKTPHLRIRVRVDPSVCVFVCLGGWWLAYGVVGWGGRRNGLSPGVFELFLISSSWLYIHYIYIHYKHISRLLSQPPPPCGTAVESVAEQIVIWEQRLAVTTA